MEEIISNFCQKPATFNKYFAWQCTLFKNSRSLLTLWMRTDKTLPSLNISEDDIFAIYKNLNSNKSHWRDDLSIKMIKLFGKSIVYPLKLIFESSLLGGEFPECWNLVPIHKKEIKNLVKNYRPISFLPIFGKIFERVIFKGVYLEFPKPSIK